MKNSTDFPETKFQLVAEMLREEIEKRGTLSIKVVSKSMAPLIRSDDKVVVETCIPETLISGDIIVFNIGKDLCTHRYILRREKNGENEYFTKGDSSFKFDPPVTENKIIGKVAAIWRQEEQIDLSRGKYRIIRFCLGTVFRMHWALFQLVRKIFSLFEKGG